MRVLITGASSFTGTWFSWALAKNGHEVYGTLQGKISDYSPVQQARFAFMRGADVRLLEGHVFGEDAFLNTLGNGFDVLCLHGAYVRDYRSRDFDVIAAVNANTFNLGRVTQIAKKCGVGRLVATGSVFEEGEGAGELPLRAASPYGLSKSISWSLFRAYAERADLPAAKFVIPNPFGPYEEPRFCAYLIKTWANGRIAHVKTPFFIRDNVPIDLLATAYVNLVARSREKKCTLYANPSCYVESQGSFAQRFAREIGTRLGLETPLCLAPQTEFSEPRMRVNTEQMVTGWDETAFWNELAEYYNAVYL